jgi:hypothetical protein
MPSTRKVREIKLPPRKLTILASKTRCFNYRDEMDHGCGLYSSDEGPSKLTCDLFGGDVTKGVRLPACLEAEKRAAKKVRG